LIVKDSFKFENNHLDRKKKGRNKMRIFISFKIILATTLFAMCISMAVAEQENQTINHATIPDMYNISSTYSDAFGTSVTEVLPSMLTDFISHTANISNTPGILDIPGKSNLTSNTANANIVLLPNMTVNIIMIQNMTVNSILSPALGVIAKKAS
jgi:hypothetical protein